MIRHRLAAAAIVVALPFTLSSVAQGATASLDGQITLAQRLTAERCDPLDPNYCLFPWPNDHFTVADGGSDTGLRINLNILSMPKNILGKPMTPTEWNRNDGFSPGEPALVRIPGLDAARSGLVPITNIADSFRADQPVVVIDADTGERQLIWSEIDDNRTKGTACTGTDVIALIRDVGGSLPGLGALLGSQPVADLTAQLQATCRAFFDLPLAPLADPGPALIVRPAVNYKEGHRYIVALRDLRNASGATIEAGPAFRIFRDRVPTTIESFKRRRAHMESLFATLGGAGIARESLYLAWDFTVASERGLSERMLHIRDESIARLGTRSPAFTVDKVTDFTPEQDSRIAREVSGRITVPNYLTLPNGAAGSRYHYALLGSLRGDDLPDVNPLFPTLKADYTCRIPRSASAANPARISLYGHGLLGSRGEVAAGNVSDMASENNFVFCAADWIGLSQGDIVNVLTLLLDMSNFATLTDRTQQGFLNFIHLGRALLRADGFGANRAFQDASGRSLLDTRELFYDGNSQGGIYGGSLVAVSPDIRAGVLGVPGMNYSTLLQRSVDFDQYAAVLYTAYPASLDQQMVLALIQMLWDRGETNGYVHHLNATNPLPNTPPKRVLLQPALGDHQVSMWTAEAVARTIGAEVHCPAVAGGPNAQRGPAVAAGINPAVAAEASVSPTIGIGRRHPDDEPYYGIPCIANYPYRGSALTVWDSGPTVDASGVAAITGVAPPPIGNVPPRPELGYGADPHSYPRSTFDARRQKSEFLRTDGAVIDPCNGRPCATRGFVP